MGELKMRSNDVKNCLTLAEALNRYTESLPDKKAKSLRSALFRFVVPGLGGVHPKGERMTPSEIEESSNFIASVSLERLSDALDIQAREMQRCEIKLDTQRVHRCHLKAFVDWCETKGLLNQPKTPRQIESYRLRQHVLQIEQKRHLKKRDKYTLDDSEISDKLAVQLREYEEFERVMLGKRQVSIQTDVGHIKRVLGWLHHFNGVSLEDLSLECIVPFVKMQFDDEDFKNYQDFAVARVRAEKRCISEGQKADALMHKYFAFLNCSGKSFTQVVSAVVNVAKFLYKGEIAPHQTDRAIPAIQILRKTHLRFQELAKHQAPVIPKEERMVDWDKALEVLEALRFEADMEYNDYPSGGRIYKQRRQQTGIADSLCRFLVVAFFVLMPPDRQRTIRELKVGRTLVKGSRDTGVFIPVERMKDRANAQWWIHLMPEDYKTGGSHGEQWHLVPNTEFGDGKTFYGYIDLWLNEYRDLFEPVDQVFFPARRGKDKGKPMNATGICCIVQHAFKRFTGVPVTPHRLRDMYVTYLKRNGAPDAALDAAALRMHHSRAMQSEIYNQQTKAEKIAPIYDLHSQIVQNALKKNR